MKHVSIRNEAQGALFRVLVLFSWLDLLVTGSATVGTLCDGDDFYVFYLQRD